jgi:hypothetical protein
MPLQGKRDRSGRSDLANPSHRTALGFVNWPHHMGKTTIWRAGMRSKANARFNRLFDRLQRQVAISAPVLAWLRRPSARLVRIPLGILLILGGIFSFLPVLGIWMLPLGLLLLAIDVPVLQGPVSGAVLRIQRKWTTWRRRKR